jgi:hypothetical protein
MQWFRAYSRMIDDDKLRLLAFEDRWHFVALCCLKSEGALDGELGSLRDRRIAVRLGVQVRELEEIGRRLREVELIDENMHPVSWDKLQYRSDNSSERVKKHRENKARNAVKQPCNVSETLPDTDTDTELEPKGSCASGDALKPEHILEHWNDLAGKLGKPKARDLTPERRKLLKARIAQYSIDDFVNVFGKIERSPFLRGDTPNWRGATFDWIFKKANFQKTLEGNYDQ